MNPALDHQFSPVSVVNFKPNHGPVPKSSGPNFGSGLNHSITTLLSLQCKIQWMFPLKMVQYWLLPSIQWPIDILSNLTYVRLPLILVSVHLVPIFGSIGIMSHVGGLHINWGHRGLESTFRCIYLDCILMHYNADNFWLGRCERMVNWACQIYIYPGSVYTKSCSYLIISFCHKISNDHTSPCFGITVHGSLALCGLHISNECSTKMQQFLPTICHAPMFQSIVPFVFHHFQGTHKPSGNIMLCIIW